MHILFKSQVLCTCKPDTRSCDPLDSGVICKVQDQYRPADRSCLFKIIYKILGFFKCYSDCNKDDRKIFLFSEDCLTAWLSEPLYGYAEVPRRKTPAASGPLLRVFKPSIDDIPVWMNSSG